MSKSDACELDILKYVFTGVSPSWAAVTTLFASLHTADPGEAATQATSEIAYTGYTRVTIGRSTSATGWTAGGTSSCTNNGVIAFPASTGSPGTASYIGVGCSFSGAGELLYSGSLTTALYCSAGVTPSFDTASVTATED